MNNLKTIITKSVYHAYKIDKNKKRNTEIPKAFSIKKKSLIKRINTIIICYVKQVVCNVQEYCVNLLKEGNLVGVSPGGSRECLFGEVQWVRK